MTNRGRITSRQTLHNCFLPQNKALKIGTAVQAMHANVKMVATFVDCYQGIDVPCIASVLKLGPCLYSLEMQ